MRKPRNQTDYSVVKKQKFLVELSASLPCSARMEIEAENEECAKQYAYDNYRKFQWEPSWYTPDGATVEAEIVK